MNRLTSTRALIALALCALTDISTAASTSEVPVCPGEYPRDGVVLTKIPHGWVGEVDEGLVLQAVGIAVGEPNHESEIIPSRSRKVQDGSEVIYDKLTRFPQRRWIMCGYGATNNVKLYRPLAPAIERCTMHYAAVHPATKTERLDRYRCD